MAQAMTFDAFKALAHNEAFKEKLTGRTDIIDLDSGTMVIYSEHINKYLEKYCCKNAEDLENTLWYSYGVFVKVIE